jgi:hypothetical protein
MEILAIVVEGLENYIKGLVTACVPLAPSMMPPTIHAHNFSSILLLQNGIVQIFLFNFYL